MSQVQDRRLTLGVELNLEPLDWSDDNDTTDEFDEPRPTAPCPPPFPYTEECEPTLLGPFADPDPEPGTAWELHADYVQ